MGYSSRMIVTGIGAIWSVYEVAVKYGKRRQRIVPFRSAILLGSPVHLENENTMGNMFECRN